MAKPRFHHFTPTTLLLLIFSLSLPFPTYAQSAWSTINPNCVGPTAEFFDVPTIVGIECLVAIILQIAISLIGVAVLVMLLIGGFKLLTSGGDPKGVAAGKQTITYAIMGLILAISAWFIINLIAAFTGANIRVFDIFLE